MNARLQVTAAFQRGYQRDRRTALIAQARHDPEYAERVLARQLLNREFGNVPVDLRDRGVR
jgi:hypothetical protein